jgi:hypothetical protein
MVWFTMPCSRCVQLDWTVADRDRDSSHNLNLNLGLTVTVPLLLSESGRSPDRRRFPGCHAHGDCDMVLIKLRVIAGKSRKLLCHGHGPGTILTPAIV